MAMETRYKRLDGSRLSSLLRIEDEKLVCMDDKARTIEAIPDFTVREAWETQIRLASERARLMEVVEKIDLVRKQIHEATGGKG